MSGDLSKHVITSTEHNLKDESIGRTYSTNIINDRASLLELHENSLEMPTDSRNLNSSAILEHQKNSGRKKELPPNFLKDDCFETVLKEHLIYQKAKPK